MNGEHSSRKMVTIFLDEMIAGVVNSAKLGSRAVEEEETPYLRDRNLRVRAIQAEFHSMFPQFESELQDLRVGRRVKGKKKRRSSISMMPARRSSRVARSDVERIDGLEYEELGADGYDDAIAGGILAGGDLTGGDEAEGDEAGGDEAGGDEAGGDEAGGDEPEGDESEGDLAGGALPVGGPPGGDLPGGYHPGELPGGNFPGEEPVNSDLGHHGCAPCGLAFRDTGNLKRHVQLVHRARLDMIKCPRPWCKAEFNILAEMREHKKGCFKVCPYTDCLKSFVRPDKFAAHQRSHLVMASRMAD